MWPFLFLKYFDQLYMRVVLDTNVLIDGIRDEYSYQKRILDEVTAGRLEAFANDQTLRENKLLMKQLIDNPEYEAEIENFFSQVTVVVNRHTVNVVRDHEDNKILESAVESESDYLITNDNDLLSLEDYEGVKIVTPAEFWSRYHDEGQDFWQSMISFMGGKK